MLSGVKPMGDPWDWRKYAAPLDLGSGSTDEQWDELLKYEPGHWAYEECDYCMWDASVDYEHPCPSCNDSGVVLRGEVNLLLGERAMRILLEGWRMAEARERLLLEIEAIKARGNKKGN